MRLVRGYLFTFFFQAHNTRVSTPSSVHIVDAGDGGTTHRTATNVAQTITQETITRV